MSADEPNKYDELGGNALPAVYIDAIKRDCPKCKATVGLFCEDEKRGGPRGRPHGSRMVVVTRIGESEPKTERS